MWSVADEATLMRVSNAHAQQDFCTSLLTHVVLSL